MASLMAQGCASRCFSFAVVIIVLIITNRLTRFNNCIEVLLLFFNRGMINIGFSFSLRKFLFPWLLKIVHNLFIFSHVIDDIANISKT